MQRKPKPKTTYSPVCLYTTPALQWSVYTIHTYIFHMCIVPQECVYIVLALQCSMANTRDILHHVMLPTKKERDQRRSAPGRKSGS